MAAQKPIDPSTLSANWSLQRVHKPRGKLFPGPPAGTKGDWRIQLFLDRAGNLYERHRVVAYEKPIERWFAITSYEAVVDEFPSKGSWAMEEGVSKSPEQRKQSKAERAGEKQRQAETNLRYSLSLILGDLVDEIEFAMVEGLFGEDGQKLLRRLMKRAVEIRTLSYSLGQPHTESTPRAMAIKAPPTAPGTETIQ